MTWTAELTGHHYELVFAHGLWPASVLAVLSIALVAAGVALGRRHGPAVGVVGVVVLAMGLAVALASEPSKWLTASSLQVVFRPVLVDVHRSAAAALVALVVGVLGATWAAIPHEAFVSAKTRVPFLVGAVLVAALGGVAFDKANTRRKGLAQHWNLPALRVATPLDMHVGHRAEVPLTWATQAHQACSGFFLFQSCTWEPGLSSPVELPGCEVEARTVQAVKVGANEVRVTGSCTWPDLDATLHVDSPITVTGLEERGDARFPLRVGNQWSYVRSTWQQGGALFWGILQSSGRTTNTDVEPLVVEVTRAYEEAGLHRFELTIAPPQAEKTTLVLVAADGAVWQLWPDGRRTPLLETRAEQGVWFAPFSHVVRWQDGGAVGDEEAKALDALKHLKKGKTPKPVRFTLPGPLSWQESRGGDLGSVLATVLTLGLVIPGSSGSEWALLKTRAGDGEAAPE